MIARAEGCDREAPGLCLFWYRNSQGDPFWSGLSLSIAQVCSKHDTAVRLCFRGGYPKEYIGVALYLCLAKASPPQFPRFPLFYWLHPCQVTVSLEQL